MWTRTSREETCHAAKAVAVLVVPAGGRTGAGLGDSGASWFAAPIRTQESETIEGPAVTPNDEDPIALLQRCIDHYDATYQDYTCITIKHEVVQGRQKDRQKVAAKFMGQPHSVYLKWLENPDGADRVLYVEGKYGGRMLVNPAGLLGLLGTLPRPTDDAESRRRSLRRITDFGFRNIMTSLLDVYKLADQRGDLTSEYGGRVVHAESGRTAIKLTRYLKQKPDYPAWKTDVYIDEEYLVPIGVDGWDWDKKQYCHYAFKDIRFNIGLTEKDFLPESNGMTAPK